jgi:membrane-bound lytic murein transglycosylase A
VSGRGGGVANGIVASIRAGAVSLPALLLVHCSPLPRPSALEPPVSQQLSVEECRAVLRDGSDPSSLRRAAEQSLDYYRRVPEDQALPLLDRKVTIRELRSVIESLFAEPLERGNERALCERFLMLRAAPKRPLLITGYYEPEIEARRARSDRFRHPIYGLPSNLVEADPALFCPRCTSQRVVGRVQDGELVPYYARAEIEAGAIDDHAPAIAWLDDPVEAFFLHVQGSGLLRFDDGVRMHVSYNGSNGRPYTSIGRVLVDNGRMTLDEVSLSSLKQYLHSHPAERDDLLRRNERYIFFRTVPVGPVGSLGVPLTAGRSLAADARVYPPGALVLLQIAPTSEASAPITRLALVQDAGVAIAGDHRLDVYWGSGETAAAIAGGMRATGELYFFLPR